MNIETILFYLMAFITVGSALFVAYSDNLVRSIFMFFITLFGLAGLYVFALADFVAITQIVIYVGGILVLILFAFMLSGRETLEQLKGNTSFIGFKNWPSLLLAALFFVVLVNIIVKVHPDTLPWITTSVKMNNVVTAESDMTGNIGVNLMTLYLLPFEAVSVLLMMGAGRRGTPVTKGGRGMIGLTHFLIISAILFCIGLYMVLTKHNAVQVLIGIELILNAAILNLVAFGKYDRVSNSGQTFAIFAIVLAAATTAVALAIILNVYRRYKTIDPDKIDHLKN